jgi:cyclic-di-AMP phosphodiesterase PgpH
MLANDGATSISQNALLKKKTASLLGAALIYIILMSAIVSSQMTMNSSTQYRVGDVAGRDILAPRRITYVSQVLTELSRQRMESTVQDFYNLPDPKIAKEQINRANSVFDYINTVRNDSFITTTDKEKQLQVISDFTITPSQIQQILQLDENNWDLLRKETIAILDQSMREEIREQSLDLARRRLPTLISLEASDTLIPLTVAIAEDFIKPNTVINQERTAAERIAARNNVEPVQVTLEKNEIIIRSGDIIQANHLEALEQLGLQSSGVRWQKVAADVILVFLSALLLGMYLYRFQPKILLNNEYLNLTIASFLFFMGISRIMIPEHLVLSYLFPCAAVGLILATLIDYEVGLFVSVLQALLLAYMKGGSLEFGVFALLGSCVGILSLNRIERLNELFKAGAYVGLVNVLVVLLFRMPTGETDWVGIATLCAAGVANGLLSASLALIAFFLVGNFSNIITPLQLMELARPTHPLLKHLLLKAPGTYHHSLIVSNMAEQAAENIGANALLTRVGTYYHDIGKAVRPYFFVENTTGDSNFHQKLDPHTSAQIIINHVKDGMDLAQKYRLPKALQAFISEHQGTGLVRYFLHEAKEKASDPSKIDENDFRYPGPKPQSRETAILMLADAAEAAVRAETPASVEETEKIVDKTINERIICGELNECGLTIKDLKVIRETFIDILQGVFHPRIKYPEEPSSNGRDSLDDIQDEKPAKIIEPHYTPK